MKRDLPGQLKVNEAIDEYYYLIEVYKGRDRYDQELVWLMIQNIRKNAEKRKRDSRMINVAICDDDVATTGNLETMLQEIAKTNFVQTEMEVFWDGKEADKSNRKRNLF